MKANVYTHYGSTKNLKLLEVDKPSPCGNEVLVRIHASSINSWDWDLVHGKPRIYRLMFGLFRPKHKIIGIDIAGKVEAVGSDVKTLKVGDDVFGDISESGFGAFAEYVCAPENLLEHKPSNASFENAAAIPHGGVLALQSVMFNGLPEKGDHILINGAGGSTGPFAVQIAKIYGAKVTCVDTERKFKMLRSLGVDHLIDYTKEDYRNNGQLYDLIIDLVAHKSIFDYNRSLSPNGAVTIVGGSIKSILQTVLFGNFITRKTNKKMGILVQKPGKENLETLKALYDEGKIKSIIDKTYSLEQVPEAIQYLGEGQSIGKLVIRNI